MWPSGQLEVETALKVSHSVKQAYEDGGAVSYQVSGESSESSFSCFNKIRGAITSETLVKRKFFLQHFLDLISNPILVL